jgi:hypothetical protein
MARTRTCRNCERDLLPGKYFTRGRCQMCANYWQRHGEERPRLPPGRLARPGRLEGPGPHPCIHCGRLAEHRGRGRCMACYQYWRRHGGVERPLRLRPRALRRLCQACGRAAPRLWQDRCWACYRQGYRHSREASPRPCQTCGQRAPGLRRGRCLACYMYWYRHGRERPAELWRRWLPVATPERAGAR